MKRSILPLLVGFNLAAFTSAYAQGGIVISNYQDPFNQVLWGNGQGVRSSDGVTLTLWYGEGVLDPSMLLHRAPLSWNITSEGLGYYGYYYGSPVLYGWSPGETWTFQVRATVSGFPGYAASILWTESENIGNLEPATPGGPPRPPGISTHSIGLIIPEPSAAGLALALYFGTSLLRARRT